MSLTLILEHIRNQDATAAIKEVERLIELQGSISTFDPVRDVEDFHAKFQIDYRGKPRVLDEQTSRFRLKFLNEEIAEYEKHMDAAHFELDKLTRSPQFQKDEFAFDRAAITHELSQQLDALVDIVYVALGTAHLQGLNFREAWRRVHEANMKKQRAHSASNANEKLKMKVVKPKGWEAPKHDDLVEDHIHGGGP